MRIANEKALTFNVLILLQSAFGQRLAHTFDTFVCPFN